MSHPIDVGERLPLTASGRRQLQEELARLEERLRELQDLIEEARADRTADDDESAATLALLDEYDRMQARHAELRSLLASVSVAPAAPADTVDIGTVVRVREEDGSEATYVLVSPAEAAPANGRISVASPLGRALRGRRVGETATVRAPGGEWTVTIVGIASEGGAAS